MHIVIGLLILIVVILLGGAGLIFSLVYALFVLAWTILPWLAGMIAIMFLANILKGMGGLSLPRFGRRLHKRSAQIPDETEPDDGQVRTYVDPSFHSNAPSREERKRLREESRFPPRGG